MKAPHTDTSQNTFSYTPSKLARALFPCTSDDESKTLFLPVTIPEMSSELSNPNHLSSDPFLKSPMTPPLTTFWNSSVSSQVVSSNSYGILTELNTCTKHFSFSSLDYYLTLCVLPI